MSAASRPTRRVVDHVVLPVANLAEARARFEDLGFLVAPEAVHPFGTANACVYFSSGPYLEPLAIGDPTRYTAACADNPFVAMDARFRTARSLPMISALALRSEDAEADRLRLARHGLGDPRTLAFERPFRRADGTQACLSFRLAFAAPEAAPGVGVFFCEARHAEAPDRTALTRHPNGARAIRRLLARPSRATDPRRIAMLLGPAANEGGVADRDSTAGMLEPDLEWLAPEAEADRAGALATLAGAGIVGVVIAVADLHATRRLVREGGEPFENRFVVPLAPGGPIIVFEEDRTS